MSPRRRELAAHLLARFAVGVASAVIAAAPLPCSPVMPMVLDAATPRWVVQRG